MRDEVLCVKDRACSEAAAHEALERTHGNM